MTDDARLSAVDLDETTLPAVTAGRAWPAAAVRNCTRPVGALRAGLAAAPPDTGTAAIGAGAGPRGRASAGV